MSQRVSQGEMPESAIYQSDTARRRTMTGPSDQVAHLEVLKADLVRSSITRRPWQSLPKCGDNFVAFPRKSKMNGQARHSEYWFRKDLLLPAIDEYASAKT